MTMKINRDNYEIYFVDFLEGELTAAQIKDLQDFLLLNPDLKKELDEMKNIFVTHPVNDTQVFENKETLKKNIGDKVMINGNNINEFLIAYLENDLKTEDAKRLEHFLSENPSYLTDLELLKKTYLKPDLDIVYNEKNKLKKKTAQRIVLWPAFTAVSVAASLVLIFMLFNRLDNTVNQNPEQKITHQHIDTITEDETLAAKEDDKDADRLALEPDQSLIASHTAPRTKELHKEDFLPTAVKSRRLSDIPTSHAQSLVSEKRNEFSSIYHYMKIAQQHRHEVEDYSDIISEKPRESFIVYALNKVFGTQDTEEYTPLQNAVDIGTYGINSLADRDIINVNRFKKDDVVHTELAFGGQVVYSRSRISE